MNELLITVGIFGLIFIIGVTLYNSLVHLRQKKEEAWSGIIVQMKKRYDLIPKLVDTVKGYAKHEKETLNDIIELRQKAVNIPSSSGVTSENLTKLSSVEGMISGSLGNLFALSENYPDLKASQNFLDLQNELEEIEDQISASRRIYNSNVQILNTKCKMFPSNVIAGMFGFEISKYFEVSDDEKKTIEIMPDIKF